MIVNIMRVDYTLILKTQLSAINCYITDIQSVCLCGSIIYIFLDLLQ